MLQKYQYEAARTKNPNPSIDFWCINKDHRTEDFNVSSRYLNQIDFEMVTDTYGDIHLEIRSANEVDKG